MQNIRVYEMPDCKMVSSGIGMFGEEKFESFNEWMSSQKRCLFPKDFLFWEGSGFHWVYMYEEGMNVPTEFDIVDFKGGLYAVATGIDQQTVLLYAEYSLPAEMQSTMQSVYFLLHGVWLFH